MMRHSLIPKLIALNLAIMLSPAARAADLKPGDLCEARAQFSSDEIEQIQRWIAVSVPVPDVEAARKVVIDIEPIEAMGPEIEVRDGVAHIIVSPQMRRLNCRIVVAGYFWSLDLMPRSEFKAAIAPIRRCIEDDDTFVPCVEAAVDRLWPAALLVMENLESLQRTALDRVIDSAFLSLMMHEFGHYRLGHSAGTDDFDTLAKQEIDADIYAVMTGSAVEYVGLSSAYNFAFLGTSDALPKIVSPHDSFSCRMLMSIKISGTIAWPARVITQLAQFEDPGFRASVEGASRGEIVFGTTPIPSSCQAPSALGLDATATDLRSIAAVQAEFGPMKDLMGLRPLISRLMGLPLTTTLGKVIRSRIVTIYAVRADWWGKPADMDWLHATLDLERNKAGFLAQDYGRLIGMRAIATISLPPESQNRPELHRLFALSRYYDPGFTLNRSAEGELYMNEGKCSEAIALVSPPPATVIELGWDPLASWGNRTRIAVLREAQKKQAEGNCP